MSSKKIHSVSFIPLYDGTVHRSASVGGGLRNSYIRSSSDTHITFYLTIVLHLVIKKLSGKNGGYYY